MAWLLDGTHTYYDPRPFNNLRILSGALTASSHSVVLKFMMLYSAWDEREMSSLCSVVHSWGNRVLSHTLTFPYYRNLRYLGPYVVPSWEVSVMGKVKLFILPSPVCPNSYVFCFNIILEVLCWNLDFHSGSFVCDCLRILQGLLDCGQEGLELVHGQYRVHSQDPNLHACYPMHG